MSDHEDNIEALSVDLDVTAELTSQVSSKVKSRKPPPKEIKNKQFSITLCDDKKSYTHLLQTILDQHGKKCKVKANRPYPFKYSLPRTSKSNAIDVEQFEEYKSMIQRLSKQKKRNVTLLIQFEAVKKYVTTPRQSDDAAADSADEREDGDEEGEDSDADLLPSGRVREEDLTELDVVLAENRNQLLKKWANGHDGNATYVYPDGAQLPLTAGMIKDWAIAMKDNVATIHQPPRTALFDPSNKRAVLNPHRLAPVTPNPSAIETSVLASVFAPITSVVAELAKANIPTTPRTPSKRPRAESVVATTPTRHSAPDQSLPSSPNSLARFCKYMKDKRGVRRASQYYIGLRNNDYGPDILGVVDIKELTAPEIGMSIGDAHRFRQAASEWLNSRATRQPEPIETDPEFSQYVVRTEDNSAAAGSVAFPNASRQQEEDKSVQYDLDNILTGTKSRWNAGPLLRTLGEQREDDHYIKYLDPATLEWRPIPPGFTVPAKGDEVDEDGFLKEW